jgi:hypothetical protein
MWKGPHVSVFPILVLTEQVCRVQRVKKLSQVYINIHTHTQQVGLQLHITWHLDLALNAGHHQAIKQEHENVYRNSMYPKVGNLILLQ